MNIHHGIRNWLAACAAVFSCAVGAAEPLPPPTIAVAGHGEVTTLPDRARLALAVDALDVEIKNAEGQVNRVVRAYLDAIKPLGLKAEDIATSGASLQPEYVWDEKARKQKLVGYRARRDVQLVVRDLDQLGDLILRATQSGMNHVSPPALESSKSDALGREALARAAKDAQARADALAQALGVKLGSARMVREAGGTPPPVPYKVMAMRAEAAFDGGNQEMGLNTGEIRIAADVQVEFDIAGR